MTSGQTDELVGDQTSQQDRHQTCVPPNMWSDEGPIQAPELMPAGKGLRVDHIEGCAQASGSKVGEQGFGVDDWPTADVDHEGPIRQRGQNIAAHHSQSPIAQGQAAHEDVGGCGELGKVCRPVHVRAFVLTFVATDEAERGAEWLETTLNGCADSADTQ